MIVVSLHCVELNNRFKDLEKEFKSSIDLIMLEDSENDFIMFYFYSINNCHVLLIDNL